MRVLSLAAREFRNLRELTIRPGEGINVICGENGQGKTNLIESIWMFTGARSFRGAKEQELLRFGESTAQLTLDFFAGNREQQAQLRLGERRSAQLNGVGLESRQELAGHFLAVIFSPTNLSLVKDGPSERRRVLDLAICQLRPRYLPLLAQYNRMLTQRNTLLKDAQLSPVLLDTLDIWDASLAKAGAMIAKTRFTFVERLAPLAESVYTGISNSRETLSLRYRCEAQPDGLCDETFLREALRSARGDDLKAGYTSIGPHRDDVEISVNGISARTFGSQGQQRSAVLAWKLAESDLIEQVSGEKPVVLLDDVMSELDDGRRDYLLHHLTDRQIFITCCDPRQIQGVAKEAVFAVEAGKILNNSYNL